MTAVWGVALLAETATRAAIALLLPTRVFLALGPVTGWVIIGCLLWYSHATIRSWEAEGTGSATDAAHQPSALDGLGERDDRPEVPIPRVPTTKRGLGRSRA